MEVDVLADVVAQQVFCGGATNQGSDHAGARERKFKTRCWLRAQRNDAAVPEADRDFAVQFVSQRFDELFGKLKLFFVS